MAKPLLQRHLPTKGVQTTDQIDKHSDFTVPQCFKEYKMGGTFWKGMGEEH